MTGIDASYEVLVHATKSHHMTDVDWVQAVDELEIVLKKFVGGVIIHDKLATVLARIPTVSFYITMTSRYPEAEVKQALREIANHEDGFAIAWLEIKDQDFLVE